MAKISDRLIQNTPGRFYVDASCVDCDICRNAVPDFFHRDDDLGMSVVYRQPDNPEDIARAEEALHGCPSDSIGNDGI